MNYSPEIEIITSLPVGFNFIVQVETPSMEPTIKVGQRVHAQRIAANGVAVGDIIMYLNKNYSKPVIHRVVMMKCTKKTRLYKTKGDNAMKKDAYYVKDDEVIAKIFLESKKRNFFDFLFTR